MEIRRRKITGDGAQGIRQYTSVYVARSDGIVRDKVVIFYSIVMYLAFLFPSDIVSNVVKL